MTMKRNLLFLFILFMASLGNISCGGDDDSPSSYGGGDSGYINNGNGGGEQTETKTSFKDGDVIPSEVLASPMQYGFNPDTVIILYDYDIAYMDLAWRDDNGCFVQGSGSWNNMYIRFYDEENGRTVDTDCGALVMEKGERTGRYSDGEQNILIILDETKKFQWVVFPGGKSTGSTTTSHQASSDFSTGYTSSIYVDIYADDFSLDDVQATTSVSWLSVVGKECLYEKGDLLPSGNDTYNYTRIRIMWGNTRNTTGSDRIGNIYVTLKADDETFDYTYQVTQHAESSSGGSPGGSSSGGSSGGSSYSNMTKAQFQASYNKYAELAKSIWNNYSNMKGSATYSILSSMRSQYREVQSDMRELRSEASKNGYTLTKSEWETKSLP